MDNVKVSRLASIDRRAKTEREQHTSVFYRVKLAADKPMRQRHYAVVVIIDIPHLPSEHGVPRATTPLES